MSSENRSLDKCSPWTVCSQIRHWDGSILGPGREWTRNRSWKNLEGCGKGRLWSKPDRRMNSSGSHFQTQDSRLKIISHPPEKTIRSRYLWLHEFGLNAVSLQLLSGLRWTSILSRGSGSSPCSARCLFSFSIALLTIVVWIMGFVQW